MSAEIEHVNAEVKKYLLVFIGLLFLTMVTVAASYLHLPLAMAVLLALVIATIKGSLVVCYFMHMISEKRLIYLVLGFTVTFFAAVLLLPMVNHHDIIRGAEVVH